MYKLKIITSTVRPGRKGPIIGRWIAEQANRQGNFDAELLDLGEIGLPLMNEPVHPIMQQYEHAHTKAWSARIGEADAFIFLLAEYDYSYPAPLKNALEYLVHEWAYKAAFVVSYSAGPFAGLRAAQSLKADLVSLKIVQIAEALPVPLLDQFISETAEFIPTDQLVTNLDTLLGQLLRWTKGMKVISES